MKPHPSELPELLADKDVHLWVSLVSGSDLPKQQRRPKTRRGQKQKNKDRNKAPRNVENVKFFEQFGIHPLLIEDALKAQPSPKVERHDTYLYLVLHALTEDDDEDTRALTVDVDVFLGERFLVTHQHDESDSRQQAEEALEKDPSLLARGPAVLAHRFIDHMVDRYLPLMEKYDGEIDAIEQAIMESADPKVLERIFALKHSLQRIRRIGMTQREIFERLWRGELGFVPEPMRPFYRDVYDHFARVTDLSDGYRELVAASLDGYLSMQSHQMNEIMKLLTGISTIMLPLTFITGLYGMNFDYMPLTHWRFGYEFAWAIMIVFAVAIYLWFHRKGWM